MISVIIIRFMIIGRVCGLKTGMNIAKNKKPRYCGALAQIFWVGVISTAPSSWSEQTHQPESDIDTHQHLLVCRGHW